MKNDYMINWLNYLKGKIFTGRNSTKHVKVVHLHKNCNFSLFLSFFCLIVSGNLPTRKIKFRKFAFFDSKFA